MVDMTNDVIRFEQLFADRFTEKDEVFMELKSKSLPNPVVIHPWKVQRKQWNKRWDYSNRRNQDDRSHRGNYRNDDRSRQHSYDRHSDRSHGGENSRERYRDRSRDGENSREHYRERSKESGHNRNSESQDRNYRERDRKYEFHSAIKTYQER